MAPDDITEDIKVDKIALEVQSEPKTRKLVTRSNEESKVQEKTLEDLNVR